MLVTAAVYPSLHNLYFNPAYARDDYRQIAADVAASARPGDGVILNAPNQWEVFTYYYPDQDVYPAPYQPGPDKVESFLAPLIERHQWLFVLYWGDAESDPQRFIETWLAAHAYKAGDRWYGRVRLATYDVAPLPEEPAVALDARFGESIQLNGYALDDAGLSPGDILPVTLFWEAQAPVAERYKVTVQLLDGAGQLIAQVDTEPGDGLVPTTTWDPGQVLADRYGVPIPSDLPSGRYTLVVGLYHITTGERLPVALDGEPVGDHLPLHSISIEHSTGGREQLLSTARVPGTGDNPRPLPLQGELTYNTSKEVLPMTVTVLPANEVRSKIGAILRRLQETEEPIFISRHGKAEAVLLSVDRYNAIMDLLEDRDDELDTALGRRIQEEREAYIRSEGRDFETFVAELGS